ncbi:glycosyltransferase [Jannaschia formosa]|uniref:glycosyltransferase n=1 Tax=Jannaschia formosa TaxID=2259592 RepID=UPI000E1B98EB|nr:glycosyltransferase [Jannaschia formosa]TFL18090.1 glycosyltransferase [Jannaschia formosa]
MTGAEPRLRIVLWGTYDLDKPRTRILRDGLRANGAELTEIHGDVWAGHADKSQAGRAALLAVGLRTLLLYPVLIARYLAAPRHDVVLVPYPGQVDVLVLWPFVRLRRRRVALDMFLSLTDTVVHDRRLARPGSMVARALQALEWLACRAADRVVMDTRAHAAYVAELFRLPPGRVAAVPVGAETDAFPRLPPPLPHDGPVRILFYGQLIPLHGVGTILEAALSPRGRTHRWHLVGTGQMRGALEAALAGGGAPHVVWDEWVPYAELVRAIEAADLCLGIFGSSRKAASVVPNKVYQALNAGRSVITRASPAIAETFAPSPALALVPPEDAEALLDAIEALADAGFPQMPDAALAIARPEQIGDRLLREVLRPLATGQEAA